MSRIRTARRLAGLVGFGLLAAAVAQEMAKPAPHRTWRGRVLGVVPYDFNIPTWRRLREAYWNPDDPSLFTDRVLGVGWAINLHRARVLLFRMFSGLMAEPGRPIRLQRPDRE